MFARALADPESLSELRVAEPEEDCGFEAVLFLPAEAYWGKTVQDLYDALPERAGAPGPRGEPFDEDAVFEQYPRLGRGGATEGPAPSSGGTGQSAWPSGSGMPGGRNAIGLIPRSAPNCDPATRMWRRCAAGRA